MTLSVMIADDQPLMRSALRMCLSAEPDIDVVGEAADGRAAVAMAHRLRPDVAVMDIRMPILDGVAATRRLTSASQVEPIKVLIVTTFDLDDYVVEALRAGASGFLVKDATPDEIVHAVRVVAAGEALLSPRVTRKLLDKYAHLLPRSGGRPPAVLAQITSRERAVLMEVARGRSNAEIAGRLHVAESSVKSHVGHLLAKIGVADRVQLVIFAYEQGLVRPRAGVPALD